MLFNWDFRKHKVSMASREFLDSIENAVILNVQEVNKALYMYIPELETALVRTFRLLSSLMPSCPAVQPPTPTPLPKCWVRD